MLKQDLNSATCFLPNFVRHRDRHFLRSLSHFDVSGTKIWSLYLHVVFVVFSFIFCTLNMLTRYFHCVCVCVCIYVMYVCMYMNVCVCCYVLFIVLVCACVCVSLRIFIVFVCAPLCVGIYVIMSICMVYEYMQVSLLIFFVCVCVCASTYT